MRTYVSGCVRADAYNLILIFALRIIILPGPGPGPVRVYMTRERHVILKAALHSRLAV